MLQLQHQQIIIPLTAGNPATAIHQVSQIFATTFMHQHAQIAISILVIQVYVPLVVALVTAVDLTLAGNRNYFNLYRFWGASFYPPPHISSKIVSDQLLICIVE